MANLDADDPVDSSEDSDSDSDDDTAVLMAELNKIKAEKARDEEEKEMRQRDEEEQIRMENIYSGNPLLRWEITGSEFCAPVHVQSRGTNSSIFPLCSGRSTPARVRAT